MLNAWRGLRDGSSLLRHLALPERAWTTFEQEGLWQLCRSCASAASVRGHATPPVEYDDADGSPTALSWLRRRGPQLPEAVLQRLFRKRQVTVTAAAGTGGAKRVGKDAVLERGSQLFIPKSAAAAPAAASTASSSTGSTRHAVALAACGEMLRRRVLHIDEELLVLDKPAGLSVQGGPGAQVSLDKAMSKALRFGFPEAPRLVHRLDRETSGALVVARTAAAAAWLSAAFSRRAEAAGSSSSSSGGSSGGVNSSRHGFPLRHAASGRHPTVQRVYWAIVECGSGSAVQPAGVIEEPLEVRRADGRVDMQPAVTHYRRLALGSGFAWLELTPSTGRKHQLRLHCARHLGAPIVGDDRHGATRTPAQRGLPELLGPEAAAAAAGRMQLHARSIEIDRGGHTAQLAGGSDGTGAISRAVAPVPTHMAAILRALGWQQAKTQSRKAGGCHA